MRHIELNNEVVVRSNGFFQLEKDKEAIAEFLNYADSKTIKFDSYKEKLESLIADKYYYDIFQEYYFEDIVAMYEEAKSYNFEFQSFMAAQKFYNDYALRTNDGNSYLETYEDRCISVALYLGRGNKEDAMRWMKSFMEQRVQPATPTFLNAGKAQRGEMVSCFLLVMDDSQNSIQFVLNCCAYLSKIGGGVAVDLSNLRGLGDPIKGVQNAAKGVNPVLKLMEDTFGYYDQMGQRKGSGAAYYNIFGWDVGRFLDTKKINADEKSRIKTLSIGLTIPNKFYDLAENNEDLYVFSPHSIQQEYGMRMTDVDFDVMYDQFLVNPKIKKMKLMSAREMLTKIATTQFESGYPYIMNTSNANNQHALKGVGRVIMSNLCTEIFQYQEISEINDYGIEDIIRNDVNCTLASLNMANVMDQKKLKESVYEGMEVLTAVSDLSEISNAPSIAEAFKNSHAVGLGVMNLHGYLAKSRIQYESKEALDFVRTFFMTMNYYSIDMSNQIAKKRNGTFKGFEKSEYANGNYFDQYLTTDYSPRTDKVKALFEGIYIPTPQDWADLKDRVKENGLWHAYRLAIAPTQSISYVQNATSSVMPIVDLIETRSYAKSKTYYPMPFLDETTQFYYKSAYDIDQFKLIDLIAEAQKHIDQGISTILFVNSTTSTRELARYYLYAKVKGLKSLYYTRTKRLDPSECTSCAV